MTTEKRRPIVLVHVLFVLLVVLVALPGRNEKASPLLFLCAAALAEGVIFFQVLRGGHPRAAGDTPEPCA